MTAAASVSAVLLGLGIHSTTSFAEPKQAPKKYRTIPRKEVEKHKAKSTGIWVTYGEGVYDITGAHHITLLCVHTEHSFHYTDVHMLDRPRFEGARR